MTEDSLPVLPLDRAMAGPGALYGRSKIISLQDNTTRPARRACNRFRTFFQNIPGTVVHEKGVLHEKTGLAFVEVTLGGVPYLVGSLTKKPNSVAVKTPIEIVTGTCLFGADSITGYVADETYDLTNPADIARIHSPITKLIIDERLHIYEAETLARLSSFINDLSCQLGTVSANVSVHMPVPEYVISGLSLYARGLMTLLAFREYSAAVRSRGTWYGNLFRECIKGTAIRLEVSSPLDWINDLDLFSVPPADIPALLFKAVSAEDALWGSLVSETPYTQLTDLNYVSYVYRYLDSARLAKLHSAQLILVENPDEVPIYWNAVKAQGKSGISLSGAMTFYVHPRMVVMNTAKSYDGNWLRNSKDGFNPDYIQTAIGPYISSFIKVATLPQPPRRVVEDFASV